MPQAPVPPSVPRAAPIPVLTLPAKMDGIDPCRNRLLAALDPASRLSLLQHAQPVILDIKHILYEAEAVPRYAFFLTSGVASLVTSMPDGGTVEVGVIGRDGVVGCLQVLGPAVISTHSLMQLPGTAIRVPLHSLRENFDRSPHIRKRILEFVQVQALALGQIAACHRLHTADQRLARWLLMMQDLVDTDIFLLTQEFLAQMLGSRRTTVSAVAAALQQAGAIEYVRGHIRILDRTILQATACVCYPVVRDLTANLYRDPIPAAA